MREVPFYANREDNNSCVLACLKSILEYYGLTFSWEQLEQTTGYQPGRAAWTAKAWTACAKYGLDIRMVESFDYSQYANEGMAYLQKHFSDEELQWQLDNTNILDVKNDLEMFVATVEHKVKSPQLDDIDRMLEQECLVFVTLNSRILNGKSGYVSHAILVHEKVGKEYKIHDPGLPPYKNRMISEDLLYRAMGGDNNTSEVTGIRMNYGES